MASIFTKIINRELPAKIEFEDERCIVIQDIHPQAPTHLLVIPKKEIVSLLEVGDGDHDILGHLLLVTAQVAREKKLTSCRVIINNGRDGGQTVPHLHLHLMSGKKFSEKM